LSPEFTPVDSWEEAEEMMDQANRTANQATLNWQWELLNPGSYAIRISNGLLIFTEITHDYSEVRMQGYVYGKHYSIVCPEGESGDAHRAAFLAVITRDMFDAARNRDWVITTGFEG